jgi:hypothetical protein
MARQTRARQRAEVGVLILVVLDEFDLVWRAVWTFEPSWISNCQLPPRRFVSSITGAILMLRPVPTKVTVAALR